ncbi:FAD binding domain-containing protein [Actinophytocola oryzae]|uniref:Carbon-monoxide dehydrogenase medium subunit n=1 Tax=Actinophytocola oryzae TaxID=502181 RepID=A0A4R7VXS1_9PSEU|nr:FAD binding domain-containing protein [Actinophytocola oryzae]TDV54956.1 carbon-monoxide dehydrogenase medium subunit [Actinophytocola oryzae]
MLSKVHLPRSAAEAADLLRDGGWLIGGGTVVMPRVNTGAVPVDRLISLRHAGLAGIHLDGKDVTVGAATTLAQVGADDRLAELHPVVRSIASPPVRNLATVGGNLLVPQPHGDLAVALLALDARIDLLSADGSRTITVGEPVRDDEIVTAIHFGLPTGAWRYRKAMRRRHNSASIVTVAAVLDGEHTRIALGGVARRPVRATAAESVLRNDPDAVEEAAEAARVGIEPFDDAYASAWYRNRVLPVHVRRALLGEA